MGRKALNHSIDDVPNDVCPEMNSHSCKEAVFPKVESGKKLKDAVEQENLQQQWCRQRLNRVYAQDNQSGRDMAGSKG